MLKISGGIYKGQKIKIPSQMITRPTNIKVREAIFNVLMSKMMLRNISWENINVLDTFAGSGMLGIEALSRGAKHTTFIDSSIDVCKILLQNIQKIGINPNNSEILRYDLYKDKLPFAKCPVQLLFADPPYSISIFAKIWNNLLAYNWVNKSTIIIYECAKNHPIDCDYLPNVSTIKYYGNTKFYIYLPDIDFDN